jgi:hypothetical protein
MVVCIIVLYRMIVYMGVWYTIVDCIVVLWMMVGNGARFVVYGTRW